MTTITKTYALEYGHLLANHAGKCRNLHGHSAKIDIEVEGPINAIEGDSSEGMVTDFSRLSQSVKKILDDFDHQTIVRGDEWIIEATQLYIEKHPEAGKLMDQFTQVLVSPTAENLARQVFLRLKDELDDMVDLVAVTWWETGTARATYTRQDWIDEDVVLEEDDNV